MKLVRRKFNKLIGKLKTQMLMDEGHYDDTRCVGSTTATALMTIATAIRHPDQPVGFSDHHGTQAADRHLAQRIGEIIGELGLQCMTMKEEGLIFQPWGYAKFCVEEDYDG